MMENLRSGKPRVIIEKVFLEDFEVYWKLILKVVIEENRGVYEKQSKMSFKKFLGWS